MKVRDNNRQKLYDAEQAYWSAPNNAELKALETAKALRYSSIVEVVEQLTNRLDLYDIRVEFKPDMQGASYFAYRRLIEFTGEDAPVYFAIHEVAHALHQDRADEINRDLYEWNEGHGPAFAQAYVDCVKEFYGQAIADDFAAHLHANGIETISPVEEAIRNTNSSEAILKDAKSLQKMLTATIAPNENYINSKMFDRTNARVWFDIEADYVTVESSHDELGTTMSRGGVQHIVFRFTKDTWALAEQQPEITRKGNIITIKFFSADEKSNQADTRFEDATITIDCAGLFMSGTENFDDWYELVDGATNFNAKYAPDFTQLAA